MGFSRILAVGLLAGAALFGPVAGAHAQSASLASLDEAIGARDWGRAEAIAAQLDAEAGQGDVMAAYAASVRHALDGECAEAVVLADLVIGAVPFFVPPYLVAHRCYSDLGQRDMAAARLGSLQAILPDGPEREVVSQLLQNAQSQGRPVFSGYFTVAPSTNVNRQTGEDTIDGGVWGPGQIPEEARGKRGVLFSLGGSVAVELARSEAVSLSGVLRTDIRFSTADDVFEPSFTAELPITFAVGETARAVVAPFATVGLEDDVLDRTEVGVRSSLSLLLDASQRLAFDLKLAAVDRPLDPGRSGLVADGAISYSTSLSPNTNLTTTARAVYNHTDDETLRTLVGTLRARVDTLFDNGLLVGVEGTIGQRWHWRPAPFQLEDQVDRFATGRIEASHRDFTIGPLMPSIYYEYTNSWSDNVFYDYESHDIGLTLRASF
ncbi:hypothetical protein [Pelagibacterium halotolerans]|uniref:DUF560 domain-containing protein n=1 Tax=Pelagibacterium halotolerans (strain DSM 22347 / JCM 15775 / CGMCC 1.7692 / B2) TaxID=1082931 RepID=G4RGM0_PELHB|nr:hypothetical protein [Pelagibacterium halotolerans]AEQ51079.1 hypothetical protein KKY_1044 [Pelagibacterium halotolerans B2]QJR19038.1 hypothetical protein HKM20_11670 [Pelagibacterium halotolerans]SEA04148.1 hypothetical protein SAMN05428936_101968 [Pelagibacterium halotolerans]